MRILLALILGVLGYFIAHLVFNQPIATVIGLLVAFAVYFGNDKL